MDYQTERLDPNEFLPVDNQNPSVGFVELKASHKPVKCLAEMEVQPEPGVFFKPPADPKQVVQRKSRVLRNEESESQPDESQASDTQIQLDSQSHHVSLHSEGEDPQRKTPSPQALDLKSQSSESPDHLSQEPLELE